MERRSSKRLQELKARLDSASFSDVIYVDD
jgi:hypothetical protein